MKKLISSLVLVLCVISSVFAQHTEERDLENFDKVHIDGNARLYLIKSDDTSVKLDVKKDAYLDDYITEVRDGVLYLHFKKKRWGKKDRKIKVYLSHTGLNKLDMDGFIRVESDSQLAENELVIKGDGFIKGELDINVKDLSVDLDGFSSFTLTGRADDANFTIDGFGKIKANDLDVNRVHQDADGFARIKIGS